MSKFCGVCDENIGEDTWSGHNKTQTHLRNVQQKDHSIELETENSWGDVYARDVLRVFSKFGPIVKLTMGSTTMPPTGTAVLEYANSGGVKKALEQAYYNVTLQKKSSNCMVRVTRWLPEKQKMANKELEEQERELAEQKVKQFRQDMFSSVKLAQNTQEQIEQLSWMQELTPSDKAAAEDLRNDIQTVLQQYVPELKVHLIGSFSNGLGVRGCNLSMLVEFDRTQRNFQDRWFPKPPPLPDSLLIGTNLRLDDGRINLNSLRNSQNLPWICYEILQRSTISINVARMRLMQNGKSGRLVFRYLKLQINCELYVNSGNRSTLLPFTELTGILVKLDKRVRPLFLILQLWCQQLGFYPAIFNNKNLFLLMYFYLQNTKPPVLPCLDTLNNLCDAQSKDFIDDVDVSFAKDISHIQQQALPVINNQSISDLIQGFFKFYSKYDLVNRVFCPQSGRSYNMLKFRNMKKAIDKLRYFVVSQRSFHIQDLFMIQQNVSTVNIRTNTAHVISTELLRALALTRGRVDQSWNLLTFIPQTLIKERSKKSILGMKPAVVLPFFAAVLPEGFLGYDSYAEAEKQWFQWIVELTMKILQILRIEYNLEGDYGEQEASPPSKRRRSESLDKPSDPTDFSTEFNTPWQIVEECRLLCVDTENLWSRRPMPKSHPHHDIMDEEEKLTTKQVRVEAEKTGNYYKKTKINFSIVLKHVKTANEIQLEMYLDGIGISMLYYKFRDFFSNYASHILNQTLKMHKA